MVNFLKYKQDIVNVMNQSADLAERLKYASVDTSIRELVKAIGRRELMIVVAGEAKRGKSSLLNAILNEKEPLFPVDMNVCTNVVTVARYGEKEKITVWITDPKSENGYRVEPITRNQIAEYVSETGNKNNYKNVKRLDIEIPNELLKEGVVFVDTPGVGSLNVEHAETTYAYLPNADLLLFVTDADSGLSDSEVSFLKRGYSYCKSVIFPLTKMDLNPNYMTIAEDNRKKISTLLDISEEEVKMIPVSSLLKQKYLETGRERMYTNSNYAELENVMWSMISKRKAEVLLLPYLDCTEAELVKVSESIEMQYNTIGRDTAQKYKDALTVEKATLKDLTSQNAAWKNDLNLEFRLLSNDVSHKVADIQRDALDHVQQEIQKKGTKICKEKNYRDMLADVNNMITVGFLDIKGDIEKKVSAKAQLLNESLKMNVDTGKEVLDTTDVSLDPDMTVTMHKRKFADEAFKKSRTIAWDVATGTTMGAAAGAILGGALGTVIAGPGGTVVGAELGAEMFAGLAQLGGAIGAAKGICTALQKYDQQDVSSVKGEFEKYIIRVMRDMTSVLTKAQILINNMVITSFDNQVKVRMETCQDEIARIEQNMKLANQDIPKKKEELKQQFFMVKEMRKNFSALRDAIKKTDMNEEKCSKTTDYKSKQNKEVKYDFL